VNRTLAFVWLALVTLLAGCGRGPDPLEWKVAAAQPTEMQQWLEENLPLMPPKIARELRACISNIQITLPPARTTEPLEQANKLCARLHGRTVRSILIEGNELSHRMLLARVKNRSEELVTLLNVGEGATEEQRDAQMARAAEARLDLQEVRQELARGEKRLEELRGTPQK
jgi:hypothetical protein